MAFAMRRSRTRADLQSFSARHNVHTRRNGEFWPYNSYSLRPLKLHCARHTWATFALQAGESIRWVADQLGHADPALTLRVYAHAMLEGEVDLSFAEFGSPRRPNTAPYGPY